MKEASDWDEHGLCSRCLLDIAMQSKVYDTS